MMKPRVFVGSSLEALQIASAVQINLRYDAEVTVWDQGIFQLSRPSLQSLVTRLETFDFGVFVFSADDLATIRGQEHQVVRDNVLFELGLFIGGLGQSRCFILAPDGEANLHLPTDLLGVTPAEYETGRSDNNWMAATAPACIAIKVELQRHGLRSATAESGMGTSPAPDSSESISLEPKIEPTEDAAPRHGEKHLEPWLTAVIERRLEDALVELDRLIEKNEHPEDRLSFQLCRAYIIFEQSIAEGDKEYRALASQNAEKPEPWAQLSSSFLRCGFREQALAVAREGIGHFPKATGLLIAEAESLEALQRPADAEMVLEKALDSSGTDHEALSLRLYRLQARNSKNAKAIETLQKGLARSPFSFELLEAKADLLFSSGDFTGSVIAYRQLARLKPNEPSYHALLGNAFLNLEIFGLALDSYRQADTLANSKQGWIIANIGNILNNRGFYGFALEYLERALALDPGNEYAQDRLLSAKRNRVAEQQRLETAVNEGIARATKPKLEEA